MISSWTCSAIFIITMTSIMSSVHADSKINIYANTDLPINKDCAQDLRLVSRKDWLAQTPTLLLEQLTLPVKYVIISHTTSDFCYTQSVCAKRVRAIQTYHIESNHWSDIAYNFLVGGDGQAYVGRGYDHVGAHTFNYNRISIGISFIGTFNEFAPKKGQLEAAQKLIELGIRLGKISEDYVLLGHRQVAKTLSPGDVLYQIIQTWPHWSAVVNATNPVTSTEAGIVKDVRLVSRNEWLAQPPDQPLEQLALPVKYVFISHTISDFCYTQSVCAKRVRAIQTYHIESNHWSDIAYNFLVGGDGEVYVGRDWDYQGAHTFNYNHISIGISFIGTFNKFAPTKKQLVAAQTLIELGVRSGKISEDYVLLGHRQVAKTLSPGDVLYQIIQTWPHWSAVVNATNPVTSTEAGIVEDVRLVSRNEWLAQPPEQPLEQLTLPVKYVFISHTLSDVCYTQSACTKRVKVIQTYHIESNHWSDIAYNFLVGGDGQAYVGRDWDYQGAHTFHYNHISIGISFIGTFNEFAPTKEQLVAAQKLIELGVRSGKISEDYVLLGHRQVAKTLSPGDVLYRIIQTWPHWTPKFE